MLDTLERALTLLQGAPLALRITASIALVLLSLTAGGVVIGALLIPRASAGSDDTVPKEFTSIASSVGYTIESLVSTVHLPERPSDGGEYFSDFETAYVIVATNDVQRDLMFVEGYHSEEDARVVRIQGSEQETERRSSDIADPKKSSEWTINLKGMKGGERRLIVTRAKFIYPSWRARAQASADGSRSVHQFRQLGEGQDAFCYPNTSDFVKSLELVLISTSRIEFPSPANTEANLQASGDESIVPLPLSEVRYAEHQPGPAIPGYSVRVRWTNVLPGQRAGVKITRDLGSTLGFRVVAASAAVEPRPAPTAPAATDSASGQRN